MDRLITFLDLGPVPGPALETAVRYCRFENMKELERENFFLTSRLKPKNADDPNTYKARKGKSGGYEEELDDEVRENLLETMREDLKYFY